MPDENEMNSESTSRNVRIELSLDGSHACALLGPDLHEGEAEFAPIEGWPNATYKQEHAAMSAAYEALAKRLGDRPPFDIVREHSKARNGDASRLRAIANAIRQDGRVASSDDLRAIAARLETESETQASMEPLSRSEAMSRLVEYPNLQAMMQGCVSGQSTEWPLLRAELCRLLAIQDAGPNDALAGKLPTERAFTILRWCVEHDGECLGDHKDLIALARETLNAARR